MNTRWVKHLLCFLLLLGAVADIVTTQYAFNQHPNIEQRESNPLFGIGMNIIGIYALKMFFMFLIIWLFYAKQKSERQFYFWISFILFITIAQFLAAAGNFHIAQNAEVYATLEPMDTPEKNSYYFDSVKVFVFIPLIGAFLPYLLFEWMYPYEDFKKRRLIKK